MAGCAGRRASKIVQKATISAPTTFFRKDSGTEQSRTPPREAGAYGLTSYYYKYHSTYGSPKTDVQPERVTAVTVSADGRKARLTVPGLRARRIYELRPKGIRAADGTPLCTVEAAYTLNRLRGR